MSGSAAARPGSGPATSPIATSRSMPTTGVELASERLRLRALRFDDAPSIAILVNDWEVVRYTTSIPYPYDVDMARAFIASQGERWSVWQPGAPLTEEIAFAIARKSD